MIPKSEIGQMGLSAYQTPISCMKYKWKRRIVSENPRQSIVTPDRRTRERCNL
jgi:hypothetical protein